MKKLFFLFGILVFNNSYSQVFTKSFGLDYLRTTQIKLAINKNKIAPYLAFSKRKSTFGFGLSMGHKNIVEPIGIHDYSGKGNFTVDGGFILYRIHPNGSSKRLNLFFEGYMAYFLSEARLFGEFYQNIHTVQSLFKVGYEVKIFDKLSLNLAGGIGMNVNRGKHQFYHDSNEQEGWTINIIYFEREFLAAAGSIGLAYKF